jgi:hypothetical protein
VSGNISKNEVAANMIRLGSADNMFSSNYWRMMLLNRTPTIYEAYHLFL